jgi:hypothetical protein
VGEVMLSHRFVPAIFHLGTSCFLLVRAFDLGARTIRP